MVCTFLYNAIHTNTNIYTKHCIYDMEYIVHGSKNQNDSKL